MTGLLRTVFIVFCTVLTTVMSVNAQEVDSDSDSIENLFLDQLTAFPQEKIHIQTDKAAYVTGETMWMRVHLVDGVLLQQANASRYVYVELLDPLSRVSERLMLRPDSLGYFYGHLPVSESLPEGTYTLRAYTRFMQNMGEEYFFRKSIGIVDPLSAELSPQISFSFEDRRIKADIYFVDAKGGRKIIPQECTILLDEGDADSDRSRLSFDSDSVARYSFRATDDGRGILSLRTTYGGRIHNRYFPIPAPQDLFDVSFFPEGGQAPVSTEIQMAFKALNANGLSEPVRGTVYDDTGKECATFESTHLGMGLFRMYYHPERTYHAVCTNGRSVSKRFELPPASENAVGLKTLWSGDFLRVGLAKPAGLALPAQMQLVAHIRGVVIYSEPWDQTQRLVTFDREFFPAGIVHFMLIDGERNILSERLVFSSQKSTFAHVEVTPDRDKYNSRDRINLRIAVTDENETPLTGNFSVSVVDMKDAAIDTTSNILSTFLLTSELRGHIESPASYMKMDDRRATQALDVLMMTQGWRKYNVSAILKGEITRELQYPVETRQRVSGRVTGLLSSTKRGEVSLIAQRDSVLGTAFTQTDERGRFEFNDIEYPDGTWYFVQAVTRRGGKGAFIELDSAPSFPPVTLRPLQPVYNELPLLDEKVVEKSNEQYTFEHGVRVINVATVTVTAVATQKDRVGTSSPYYSIGVSKVMTESDIDERSMHSVFDVLRRLPGVTVTGEDVRYRGGVPLLILDDVPREEFNYGDVDISDIGDIFAVPSESIMPIFGTRAAGGAIVINTKRGFMARNEMNRNIGIAKPVGYRQTVEFYSPVYETDADRRKVARDLRSTIYWKPDVTVDDSGVATLTFYAADVDSNYGIVIEGASSFGHLIYSNEGVVNRE